MNTAMPHFLLFSESRLKQLRDRDGVEICIGQWRFVLQSVDGDSRLEVEDEEPESQADRLELLAVVRGLEALDQPSRVTLVTPSRYVSRGFRYGLDEWRENDWRWECYGEMIPIKNADLWQRVDQALRYHHVECRIWRFDGPQVPRPKAVRGRRREKPRRRPAYASAAGIGEEPTAPLSARVLAWGAGHCRDWLRPGRGRLARTVAG